MEGEYPRSEASITRPAGKPPRSGTGSDALAGPLDGWGGLRRSRLGYVMGGVEVSGRPALEPQPDGPLQGVKYGAVVSVDGVLRFESTTRRAQHSRCYDVESKAICQLGMDHVVPSWACTCGFYAMPDEEALAAAWGEARLSHWAVLRVEVSGRVIEHERGWRASRQVVIEACLGGPLPSLRPAGRGLRLRRRAAGTAGAAVPGLCRAGPVVAQRGGGPARHRRPPGPGR